MDGLIHMLELAGQHIAGLEQQLKAERALRMTLEQRTGEQAAELTKLRTFIEERAIPAMERAAASVE